MGKTKQKQDRSHYLFSNRELANLIGPLVIEQLLLGWQILLWLQMLEKQLCRACRWLTIL